MFPSSKEFEAAEAKDWLDIRGIKAESGVLKVAMRCPMLTEDNKCKIQDNKPEVCKNFVPGSIPECPLYKKEEKKMEACKYDRKVLTAEDIKEAKKSGAKYVEGIKLFALTNVKALDKDGILSLEGYANTKNNADRYGDIPTVFLPLRDYVYELEDYHKNPVCLLNHFNSTDSIVGSFNTDLGGYIIEDEIGLKFKLIFSKSDFPPVAHARTVYLEGHGKALSIGGRWYFEDKDNTSHLTYAEIYETSLVGVGADPDALAKLISEAEKATARNPLVEEESIEAGQVSGAEKEADKMEFLTLDETLARMAEQIK